MEDFNIKMLLGYNKYNVHKLIKINLFDVCFGLILTGIITYLILTTKYISGVSGDLGDGAYAIWAGIARTINQRELPLWSPYLWSGYYGSANSFSGAFYPISILLSKIFYDPVSNMLSYMVVPVSIIIHMVLMSISFYAFFRVLRFEQWTCIVATVLSIYPGILNRFWLSLFECTAWLPVILLFTTLAFKNHTKKAYLYCIISGFCFGMSGLANQGQSLLINILIFFFLSCFFIWEYRNEKKIIIQIILKILSIGFLGFSICSIALIPFIEFNYNALRFIPDLGWISRHEKMSFSHFIKHSVSISEIKGILGIGYIADKINILASVSLILSLFIKNPNNKSVYNFSFFTFIFCLCYSITFVFSDFLYYLPFFDAIREPHLYARYFIIAITILVAFGFENIIVSVKKNYTFTEICSNFYNPPLLGFLLIVIFLINILPHNNIGKINSLYFIILIIIVFIITLSKLNRIVKEKFVLGLLIAILFGNLYEAYENFNSGSLNAFVVSAQISIVQKKTKVIIDLLNNKNGNPYYRIFQIGNAYPANDAAALGFYDECGYVNPMYSKSVNTHNIEITNIARLKNVKYILVGNNMDEKFHNWFKEVCPEFVEIAIINCYSNYDAKDQTPVTIYENTQYYGQAWVVYDYQIYDSKTTIEKFIMMLNNSKLLLTDIVFINEKTLDKVVEGSISQDDDFFVRDYDDENEIFNKKMGGGVKIISYKANSITYSVSTETSGILYSSECFYPGWKVYVNGQRKKLMEANYYGRAVAVPEGQSIVEFKFLPISFIIGCILFSISILLSTLFIIFYAIKFNDHKTKEGKTIN